MKNKNKGYIRKFEVSGDYIEFMYGVKETIFGNPPKLAEAYISLGNKCDAIALAPGKYELSLRRVK